MWQKWHVSFRQVKIRVKSNVHEFEYNNFFFKIETKGPNYDNYSLFNSLQNMVFDEKHIAMITEFYSFLSYSVTSTFPYAADEADQNKTKIQK